jgi:prepilin-type N-terminal cleavage/methylation domain-containing protein
MNNKGFTLIELVVTIAIIMIISIPLTNMFLFSSKVNALGREEIDGISAAKKYMEELKASKELFNVDSEESIDYKGYKLHVDILGVERYASKEVPEETEFNEDIKVLVLGQYNIKYSKDDINYTSVPESSLVIEFNDKKDLYINDTRILKNQKEDLNIGIHFQDIIGLYDFSIKNFTNYTINIYILEPNLKKYEYNLDILNGRVNTYKNLRTTTSTEITPYILYKIKIDVEKNDEYITTLEGTKRFDY